ncbi:MAG: hypothetical protein HC796_07630 [Synechococcaceae cyanobacterium RL_1_2]|nr:hypothetical protein [Synechococcaceae cyanobacterium RL_1_2]
MALSIIRWIKDHQIDITESTLTTADNTAIAYRLCQDLELKNADLFDLSFVLEMFKVGILVIF